MAICRDIFQDNALVFDYGVARDALEKRCQLIKSYLHPTPLYSKLTIINTRVDALHNYMNEGTDPYANYL